jgi:hypothetical protein
MFVLTLADGLCALLGLYPIFCLVLVYVFLIIPYPGRQRHKKFSSCQAFATFPTKWNRIGSRLALHCVITANILATSGLTVGNRPLFVVRGRPPAQRVPREMKRCGTPECCNCRLAEGEKVHPANYRGCRHAKEELQKRKSQRTPKTTTGRVFSSNLTTPSVSFAAALRGSTA